MPTRTTKGSRSACGRAFAWANGLPVKDAKDYIPYLRGDPRYRELKRGDALQVDDVVVWQHYGSKRNKKGQINRGWVWGHVGNVAMDAEDDPLLVSLFTGKPDVRRISGNPVFFRRVK